MEWILTEDEEITNLLTCLSLNAVIRVGFLTISISSCSSFLFPRFVLKIVRALTGRFWSLINLSWSSWYCHKKGFGFLRNLPIDRYALLLLYINLCNKSTKNNDRTYSSSFFCPFYPPPFLEFQNYEATSVRQVLHFQEYQKWNLWRGRPSCGS